MSSLSNSSQVVDDDGMTRNQGSDDSFLRSFTMERLAQFNNELGKRKVAAALDEISKKTKKPDAKYCEWAARAISRPTSTEIQSLHKDCVQNESRKIWRSI